MHPLRLNLRLLPLSVAFAAVLLTSACQTDRAASAVSANSQAQKPRRVRVTPAVVERITRTIEATGTLAAQDQVALSSKVPGRIESLTVDLGDRVKKGQVIATLDPTDLKIGVAQVLAAVQQARSRLGLTRDGTGDRVNPEQTATVRQAKATLNEAKLSRDRAQKLFDEKLIAKSDLDSAVASYQVAEGRYQDSIEEIRNRQAVLAQRESQLALARQQLEDAILRSPIDGAVAERQASVGQYVGAGTPIATVVRLHPLRLRLPVPERAAASVRIGQQVRLTVEEDSHTYYGKVARLSPAIEAENRTLLVEAEVPNERGNLRPGGFVRAELLTQADQPAVFVPASALVTFAGLEKVITVENGKSVEKLVKTGRKVEGKVEIAQGLKPGEQVVVRPGNLIGGQSVTIQR